MILFGEDREGLYSLRMVLGPQSEDQEYDVQFHLAAATSHASSCCRFRKRDLQSFADDLVSLRDGTREDAVLYMFGYDTVIQVYRDGQKRDRFLLDIRLGTDLGVATIDRSFADGPPMPEEVEGEVAMRVLFQRIPVDQTEVLGLARVVNDSIRDY